MSGYVGFKKKKSKIGTTLMIVAALHLVVAGGLVWLASTAVGQELIAYYKINIKNVKEPEPPKPKEPEPEPEPPKPEPPKPEEAPAPEPEPEAAPPPPMEAVESAPPEAAPAEAAPQAVQLPSMGNPFASGQGKKYSGYIDLVTTEIQRLYHQPSDLSNSISLSVMFQLHIDEEGKLLGYKLMGSSGNEKFDQSALQAIAKLIKLRPPPTGMSRTIIVKFIPPP